MEKTAIAFDQVSKWYGQTPIVRDVSFQVREGEFLTIIGQSGSGKTTLLKMMNGLLMPDKGTVKIFGQGITPDNEIELRRAIGYVIQSVGLFPHMTIEKNIAYVPSLSKAWTKKEEKEKVKALLKQVDLSPELATRYPSQLSGGQKQRVGVARALAANPKLLLMDEPFGAVDEIVRKSLQEEMKHLQKELHLTIVFVTHDIREALLLGDRVMVVQNGQIAQLDTPIQIKKAPENEYVKALLERQ